MQTRWTNSREKIREWVTSNLTGFEEPTERFHGEVGPHAIVAPQSGGQGQSLYCMVQEGGESASVAIHRPVVEEMLAAVQKVPGFRGCATTTRSAGSGGRPSWWPTSKRSRATEPRRASAATSATLSSSQARRAA